MLSFAPVEILTATQTCRQNENNNESETFFMKKMNCLQAPEQKTKYLTIKMSTNSSRSLPYYAAVLASTGFYLSYTWFLYNNPYEIRSRDMQPQVPTKTSDSGTAPPPSADFTYNPLVRTNAFELEMISTYQATAPIMTTSSTNESYRRRRQFPETVLPDKVFTIVGLESSGTTFVAETIRHALGLSLIGNDAYYESIGEGFSDHYFREQGPKWTEVQHVSLPWGGLNCREDPRKNVVPVIFPAICTKLMRDRMRARMAGGNGILKAGPFVPSFTSENIFRTYHLKMKEAGLPIFSECHNMTDNDWTYPTRYTLNVTSHLEWYLSKGVDARVIIIMRDPTISRRARQEHCNNAEILQGEEDLGRELLQDTIRRYIAPISPQDKKKRSRRLLEASDDARVVLLSYELLTQLRADYLERMYRTLGINSTYEPRWHDGNVKHVKEGPPTVKSRKQDAVLLFNASRKQTV